MLGEWEKVFNMDFKNLRSLVIEENQNALNKRLEKIKTEEGLKEVLSLERKNYKGTEEQIRLKLLRHLVAQKDKQLKEDLQKLELAEQSKEFSSLIVSVEWSKSRMWGNNPTASTNYGFKGSSIGGCGYDKQSTALAEGLNSHLPLLRKLYAKKEGYFEQKCILKEQNQINREVLGCGSGYGIIPRFEGGVGVSSLQTIIENLGLKFEWVSGKTFDVFTIRRGD